jgi:hypothetical protein
MASDFEKVVLQEKLTSEVVECLLHEAHEKIGAAPFRENPYDWVYQAFVNLGMVKGILGERFEKVKRELYEEARWKLYGPNFSEKTLWDATEKGLAYGCWHLLPDKMGLDSIHYGFVAEMFLAEFAGRLRYVEGEGWEVREGETWQRRPKQRGIVGLIYKVMRRRVYAWKRALADGSGTGGWLEKLERNINDPDWLSKVEELLLRVDHFGVEIVSGADGGNPSDGEAGS